MEVNSEQLFTEVEVNRPGYSLSRSLRSKRFCGFSEQRKTEERDFDNFATGEMGAKKWSVGGGGKE